MNRKTLICVTAVMALATGPSVVADVSTTMHISVNLLALDSTPDNVNLSLCLTDTACSSEYSTEALVEYQEVIASIGQPMVRVIPI